MALMEWRCNYQALGRGIQPAITNSPTHLTNDITQHNVMNSIYEKNSFNIVDNIYGISLECVMVFMDRIYLDLIHNIKFKFNNVYILL